MITTSTQTTLKQSDDFKSFQFGIKESGLSHIFNVLRNQLYSDKVLAVIREYSCNAVDAHTEVGKADVPIKVTLPTQMTPEFKVRDFGRGLTETEIAQIYAMYGESTKRGSNEQIGQLGLGCKSAFAYGDNFIINSFVKGTKTTYNAFIDPSDIGQISKMGSEKTKEENGVEIVIPVKSDDFSEFYDKAVTLFKYFKVVPNVRGANQDDLKRQLEKSKIVIEKDNWRLVEGDSHAIMGNISYPLDSGALNIGWQDERAELLSSGVEIDFDIGDLEISASREALQYTDRTKKAIIKTLEAILKALPDTLGEKFKECKTLWDAKVLYNDAFRHGGFGGKIKKIVDTKGITWNNLKVKSGIFDKQKWKDSDLELKIFSKPNHYNTTKRVRGQEAQNIYAKENAIVIIDDAPTHHGRLNRIAPLLEEYEGRDKNTPIYETVYLLNYRSAKAQKEFLSERNFDFPAKNLTDYPKVILRDIYPSNSTVSGGSSAIKNTKHSTKVFSLDKDCSHGQWHTCRSDFFESATVDLDNDEGVYIFVRKFFYGENDLKAEDNHPNKLIKAVKALENVGIDVPPIYAFKVTEKTEKAVEGDNWTYFEDWARKEFQKKMESEGVEQELFDRLSAKVHAKNIDRLDEYCEAFIELNNRAEDFKTRLPEDSSARDYITKYLEMAGEDADDSFLGKYESALSRFSVKSTHGNDNSDRYTNRDNEIEVNRRGFFKDMEPTHDLNKLCKDCMKKYPMITFMDDNYFNWRFTPESVKETINYVTMIEATYITKKKIGEAKENIFECVEKLKEKTLDKQPQLN